jgi:hypothetical protein
VDLAGNGRLGQAIRLQTSSRIGSGGKAGADRLNEEKKFRDPEDAYLDVRRQEAERKEQGLPPRIQFLEESQPDEQP